MAGVWGLSFRNYVFGVCSGDAVTGAVMAVLQVSFNGSRSLKRIAVSARQGARSQLKQGTGGWGEVCVYCTSLYYVHWFRCCTELRRSPPSFSHPPCRTLPFAITAQKGTIYGTIRGQVWPRGWSPLLLRGGAQEDLAFWVGSRYSRRGAAIQAGAGDAGAASF